MDNPLVPAVGGLIQPTRAEGTEVGEAKSLVVLVRPGKGARKFFVPPGSTVKDLLDMAEGTGYNLGGQEIHIGTEKVKMSHVIQAKECIFLVPKPKNA